MPAISPIRPVTLTAARLSRLRMLPSMLVTNSGVWGIGMPVSEKRPTLIDEMAPFTSSNEPAAPMPIGSVSPAEPATFHVEAVRSSVIFTSSSLIAPRSKPAALNVPLRISQSFSRT